eukprot:COSAG01_NODE_6335_length_3730_cov_3.544478_4_plen_106_part_00
MPSTRPWWSRRWGRRTWGEERTLACQNFLNLFRGGGTDLAADGGWALADFALAELLKLACKHMPRLPSDRLDVLLLDHTGKNVSGTGMDTNIVGRVLNPSWDGFR